MSNKQIDLRYHIFYTDEKYGVIAVETACIYHPSICKVRADHNKSYNLEQFQSITEFSLKYIKLKSR